MTRNLVAALGSAARSILPPVIAVGLALLMGAILLIVSGHHPLEAYASLFRGAFGSTHRLAETLVKATPLSILAIGIAIAFKSEIWNIGGDGQFTIGAVLAVFVALNVTLPSVLLLPLTFLAACVGGALWGGIAGYLKARFNTNEVITTLMLVYIANYLLDWLVKGPMMDPKGFGFPQTELVDEALRLPVLIGGTRLHAGLFLALAVVVVGYFFWKTTLGFRIELVGQSREVARYSGVNVSRTIVVTMLISGGLAGIAGWVEVFGIHFRLLEHIAGGYGFLAIVVALLADLNPIGILVSAFFFAALLVGGETMKRMVGVPFSLVEVIQGLVIMFVISRVVYTAWRQRHA